MTSPRKLCRNRRQVLGLNIGASAFKGCAEEEGTAKETKGWLVVEELESSMP